jgi:hypothetical protein
MPSSGGRYSNAQLRALWIANGGQNSVAPMAAAIALAESGGDPNATDYDSNGSVDRGLWQINSVHGSMSTFSPSGNARAAVSISNNGTDWSAWTTFTSGAYKPYLDGSSATSTGTTGGGSSVSSSDGTGSSSGGALNLSLGDLLTSPASTIGDFFALVSLGIVKGLADGIGDYIIRPAWNFNLRAVDYYTNDILFAKENQPWPTLVTAVFWGFGYGLLFTDPESGNLKPAPVRKTRLARHVRRAQQLPARGTLIKPRDVAEKTPNKPEPVASSAKVRQTGTMNTSRHSTVKVTGTHARADGTAAPRDNAERATDSTGAPASEVREVETVQAVKPPAKPESPDRTGIDTQADSKSTSDKSPRASTHGGKRGA